MPILKLHTVASRPLKQLATQTSRLLFSEADLDAALVPEDCFARHFLARLTRPQFNTIAPGLIIPHDAAAFAALQRFTKMDATSEYGRVVPPVLLFAAADGAMGYRVPLQPSLDGNTVELSTEQTLFAENAVQYKTTLSFLQGRVSTVMTALKGE